MAIALKGVLWCVALALLTGCYKTELPPYSSGRPGYASGKGIHTPYYTVRHGDTLYSIGRRFGIDHKLLARRNHIRYPYTIYIGQHLYLTRIAPRSQPLPIPSSRRSSGTPSDSASKSGTHVKAADVRQSSHMPAANGHVGRLRWPIHGTVTSPFGRRGSRMHDGIDIAAKRGTPIHAAADGVVVYSDRRLSGYGRMIIIRHAGGMFTAYAHNERNLVRKGDRVKSGDVIGRVGSTGRATGPHLHFEVRRGTTPVDPKAYLP